jgi:hypothetical protein
MEINEHKGTEALPPLPHVFAQGNVLQEGCFRVRFVVEPVSGHLVNHVKGTFEGTLRVQRLGGNIIASGDLYKHKLPQGNTMIPTPQLWTERYIGKGIPIFPRSDYAFYIRVTRLWESIENGEKRFSFDFVLYRYTRLKKWHEGVPLTAYMRFVDRPDGSGYWSGEVRSGLGVIVGNLTMIWVSSHLRRAVVEIDKVKEAKWPINNGRGLDWQAVFRQVGWDVTVERNEADVEAQEDGVWDKAELHALLSYRNKNADLDKEWRYHLTVVGKIKEKKKMIFGTMYDSYERDTNIAPREGAAIAAHHRFKGKCFGTLQNKTLDSVPGPFFRTAVHEIGHAMLLYHPSSNPSENYFMQTTEKIACNAQKTQPPQKFPDNIEWSFSPGDRHYFRHLPDIAVRPGGAVVFGTSNKVPISGDDGGDSKEVQGLELTVSPLYSVVPIGAPVRVNFSLTNRSDSVITVPGSLSMKTGCISGKVVGPSGAEEHFSTITRYTDDIEIKKLSKGKSISHSLTLLGGDKRPLFLAPGFYRVIVELRCNIEVGYFAVSGEASIMVTPPQDHAHAEAARRILSEPQVLLALAIGGDHLRKGIAVIQIGLSHPVLRPHFSLIEAKRLAKRFMKRKADLKAAAELIDESAVMSPAEIKNMAKIVKNAPEETEKEALKKIKMNLLRTAKTIGAGYEVIETIESINITEDIK